MSGANPSRSSFGQQRKRTGALQSAPGHPFRALALALLLGASRTALSGGQSPPVLEYQVKAAFLLNFARFVEWPPQAFPGGNSPLTLCVFNHDPFGTALDQVFRGKAVNAHDLVILRISDLQGLRSCQLVFVSSREDKRLPEVLNTLRGTSALVVGEAEGFAERGGGIEFFLDGTKLRFAVNVDALEESRLTVSSKLLALAKIVHGQPKRKGG